MGLFSYMACGVPLGSRFTYITVARYRYATPFLFNVAIVDGGHSIKRALYIGIKWLWLTCTYPTMHKHIIISSKVWNGIFIHSQTSTAALLKLEMDKLFHLTLYPLRPRQNGRHFADDMFKCIFLNENVWIPIEISPKFVPKGSINNNPALF